MLLHGVLRIPQRALVRISKMLCVCNVDAARNQHGADLDTHGVNAVRGCPSAGRKKLHADAAAGHDVATRHVRGDDPNKRRRVRKIGGEAHLQLQGGMAGVGEAGLNGRLEEELQGPDVEVVLGRGDDEAVFAGVHGVDQGELLGQGGRGGARAKRGRGVAREVALARGGARGALVEVRGLLKEGGHGRERGGDAVAEQRREDVVVDLHDEAVRQAVLAVDEGRERRPRQAQTEAAAVREVVARRGRVARRGVGCLQRRRDGRGYVRDCRGREQRRVHGVGGGFPGFGHFWMLLWRRAGVWTGLCSAVWMVCVCVCVAGFV